MLPMLHTIFSFLQNPSPTLLPTITGIADNIADEQIIIVLFAILNIFPIISNPKSLILEAFIIYLYFYNKHFFQSSTVPPS